METFLKLLKSHLPLYLGYVDGIPLSCRLLRRDVLIGTPINYMFCEEEKSGYVFISYVRLIINSII